MITPVFRRCKVANPDSGGDVPWITRPEGPGYPYLLFRPEGPAESAGRPLLLFLHGVHERGSDLRWVRRHGPPRMVASQPVFPFVLVVPQCPSGQTWAVKRLKRVLDSVEEASVDRDRVYVTGLSMGGYGTWALACEYPFRFAAAVPVCGGGDPKKAGRLRRLPVWVIHGARDPVVPPSASEEMVRALERCGAPVRYTKVPEAGHDVWTRAYADPKLYAWLLAHRRPRTRRPAPGP